MSNTNSIQRPQAAVYNTCNDLQKGDGLKLLSLAQLQEGMKVLDLGCGTGQLASVIAEQVGDTGSVIAIDPDSSRITVAKENYGSIKNITFQDGSSESIPGMMDSCYDVVFSNFVLHWIKDKESALRNIYQCLKPSGLFAVCFVTKNLEFSTNYISLLEPRQLEKVKNMVFIESADIVEQIAVSCGFSVEHKEETKTMAQCKDFDDFIQNTYAGFSGAVDPALMDAEKLSELRQSVGEGAFEVPLAALAFYIFKKC